MYSYVPRMLLVCYPYVVVCTRMLLVCTRTYPYVTRMSPVWCISHDRISRLRRSLLAALPRELAAPPPLPRVGLARATIFRQLRRLRKKGKSVPENVAVSTAKTHLLGRRGHLSIWPKGARVA